MIKFFLQGKTARVMALASFMAILANLFAPTAAYALTSGPSQPEVQAFEPVGTTEMVDLFTGDFTYNIPLFELPGPNGGYPFNLAYHAGVGMDEEASWVGLGWSLNPGAITRQMRGLPDEFKGDKVTTMTSMKPNTTLGGGGGSGVELFGHALGFSRGIQVFNNSYKGVGFSLENSISGTIGGILGGNASLVLNTQEGVTVSQSFGLGPKLKNHANPSITAAGSYNSRHGLQSLSVGLDAKGHSDKSMDKVKKLEDNYTKWSNGVGAGSGISLLSPGYTPSISYPMYSENYSSMFKGGMAVFGVFPNVYIKGFYSKEELKNNGKVVDWKGYGYMHFEDAAEDNAMTDINREKDGMVNKNTPNLGIPSHTYDVYSVNGQGMAAMYRPFRSDIGVASDPKKKSGSHSLGIGADLSIPFHLGFNADLVFSESVSQRWDKAPSSFRFEKKDPLFPLYEPWYFKSHGELTTMESSKLDGIGGEKASRFNLVGDRINPDVVTPNGMTWQLEKDERASKNQIVTPFTVNQLLDENGEPLHPLFNFQYLDAGGGEKKYKHESSIGGNDIGHHIAGLLALTPDGVQYNYCLPAYNYSQKEVAFSVKNPGVHPDSRIDVPNKNGKVEYKADGTNEFYNETNIPAYAHSYLLTSITGPDYVDVGTAGLDSEDLGYWVKFTYKQAASKDSPYYWRSPYNKANFDEGFRSTDEDDRASYIYGEKEVWYLAQVETKSHVVVFSTSPRNDGHGALSELANGTDVGKESLKLDRITLYTRQEYNRTGSKPLKNIVFSYAKEESELCGGVYNASTGRGKLTLEKVWFEYGSSAKGQLNPYIFGYGSNPNYDMYQVDRWGNYYPYREINIETDETDEDGQKKEKKGQEKALDRYEFPYIDQTEDRGKVDTYAAAWNLTDITLPSGGKIHVDYEADDYAYVQERRAMQMVEIAGFGQVGNFEMTGDRVYFKLEKPIPKTGDPDAEDPVEMVMHYFDENRDGKLEGRETQIYFKTLVKLRKEGEKYEDFVSGYVDVDSDGDMGLYGEDNETTYNYGYFTVEKENGNHPFRVRAWQHLQAAQPDLATPIPRAGQNPAGLKGQIQALLGVVMELEKLFTKFDDYAKGKEWSKKARKYKSWVRLYSPDGIKYGGGHRVKQVVLSDQWQQEKGHNGIYGQAYDYAIEEGGEMISSGVAANEPQIGGDENALHYAKKYNDNIPLNSNNNLFFEYPVNESYYPGPQVGYRRVAVKSLASGWMEGQGSNSSFWKNWFGASANPGTVRMATTGMTVQEFYTAKDFPVQAFETPKQDLSYQLQFSLLGIFDVSTRKLAASQGYSVVLNDMHGKPKKVSHYAQGEDGTMDAEPYAWVKYNYFSKKATQDGKEVAVLDNLFASSDWGDGSLYKPANKGQGNSYLGVEQELVLDMREHADRTWEGGGGGNVEVIPLFFFVLTIPSWWPNLGMTERVLRTAVVNKVVHKSGILSDIEAYNDGSYMRTSHKRWDAQTGRPVLSVVNNNFDAPVYSWSNPAYKQYPLMGPAYRNVGMEFSANLAPYEPERGEGTYLASAAEGNNWEKAMESMLPGDEVIIYSSAGNPLCRAAYVGDGLFEREGGESLPADTYSFFLYRSGNRNILNADAGSVTSLEDPSAL